MQHLRRAEGRTSCFVRVHESSTHESGLGKRRHAQTRRRDAMRQSDRCERHAERSKAASVSGIAASMIHQSSHRRRAPFVAINAADVWDTAPYTAGDTTDPVTEGLLQAADDGTLFIQDIEKIPASAQLQLLRFMDCESQRRETRAAHDGDRHPSVRARAGG